MSVKQKVYLLRTAILGLSLLLWEVLPRLGILNPIFFPTLSSVLSTLHQQFSYGELATHTRLSLERVLLGLFFATITGTVLGFIIAGVMPRIAEVISPLVEFFTQANPVILFHVILLFFGIGEAAKVFIIAWMCTWPIMFSVITGARQVDANLIKTARAFGLGVVGICYYCLAPASISCIMTGIRLSAGYAFIMLVATEMMGASSGLGWFVIQSQEAYDPKKIFAGALVITLLALLLDGILKSIEQRLVHWNPKLDERRILIEGNT